MRDLATGSWTCPDVYSGVSGCYVCGKLTHDDGSPVTWKCQICDRTVCRDHTLTIPGRWPPEYYTMTLCKPKLDMQIVEAIHEESCWELAGRPDE